MKIKEITIENFRSYYGKQTIKFNDGLMLFIGDNGDGKTTFFEALEWLFDTSNHPNKNIDINLISKKKIAELSELESAYVLVSLVFEHDGEKVVEKSFTFIKIDGKIQAQDFQFKGWLDKGAGREQMHGGELLDRCFEPAIRKYCLFKGEENLNVFKESEALNYLIDTFSNIKQFDPYYTGNEDNPGFTDMAEEMSLKAYQKVMKSDQNNAKKVKVLSGQLNSLRDNLGRIRQQLRTCRENANIYSSKLEELEGSKDVSEQLERINKRLQTLIDKRNTVQNRIDENYSIKLLDDMWILCAFPEVLKDFQDKVDTFSQEKRRLQDEENKKRGKQEAYQEISNTFKNGFIPLSIYIPDAKTMREMIEDEVCKVCGRPAKKGTDEYNFMVDKLNQLLKEQTPQPKENISLFPYDYEKELEQKSITFGYLQKELNNLPNNIKELIEFNAERKSELQKLNESIDKEEDAKRKLLAQNDSLTEDQLKNAYENIKNWYDKVRDYEKQIVELEGKEREAEKKLGEVQAQYDSLAKNSQASTYCKVYTAFDKIKSAFKMAKEKNSSDFLSILEDSANEYLEQLNVDGFRGEIHIIKELGGSARIVLQDRNNLYVTKPNQALKTTMFMSVLFAVSKITTIKRENDYPLIFDAPTSSFAPQKECDFFRIISDIKKQCIIFSKSFLTDDGKIDNSKMDSLHCTIYRMEKAKPFDPLDLSTIATVLTKIK